MSDEEKRNVEILNNIKEYMQNSIDNGYHKFIYNDLDWDEKCVDIINAIDYFIEKVEQQQKEIEEKTTIIMAGAEKVKQLEKGNRSLMESRIKWKNRYYKEKAKNKECISKDKIRELIENNEQDIDYSIHDLIEDLKKILEEK